MKRRVLLGILFLFVSLPAAWYGYGLYLASGYSAQARVEIRTTTPLAIHREKTLPFYELMSPLPDLARHQLLPRLEYKKGPPSRFIEKITILVQPKAGSAKERIIYHGRRSREDFPGLFIFPEGPDREARYLETALRLSQGEPTGLSAWQTFLLRPPLLKEAAHWLRGVESVEIMEQAGAPAFLFRGQPNPEGRVQDTALFIRRNSFYRVDSIGDAGFFALDPLNQFRKSFLTDRRADALEYVSRNLSQVKLNQSLALSLRAITWPILLLAANVSVDPSSLDAYFHFAGISALLYRSMATDGSDQSTLDLLRNNVLASEFYAKDIKPSSKRAAEIARLARLLTRNFE